MAAGAAERRKSDKQTRTGMCESESGGGTCVLVRSELAGDAFGSVLKRVKKSKEMVILGLEPRTTALLALRSTD